METLMQEAQKIAQLKTLVKKRSLLMQKINSIDENITSLLSAKGNGKVVPTGKQSCPKEGSAPYKLCQAMGSQPMTLEQIANKTKLKVGTVKGYIHQYTCFKLVGYGKGYVYEKGE
jgi:hypothetical protein